MPRADRTLAIVSCCAAIGTLIPVALFQGQVTDYLPDPPGAIFASERIVLSKEAHPLGIPDAYLGLASYATTLTLLVLSRRNDTARKLLGAKLTVDASMAGFNVVRQVVRLGRLCSWCTGTALATAGVVYGERRAIANLFQDTPADS